ncbi:hypothetical protein BN59_02847 [Legionella massiliensis]|uniref:Uncharacterized protein n=1 Tax=Legionella massiliensis TaxID=1034943 RepID=A0A078KZV6_9GAMM|nr:hypothetical protein [Legionella massiliensis]CDZ78537.1 hypothetical protein BN59_02847 [Legionella massiliensis]CEE14275.1 hypothetical protein BN1094_02847 [Legionella massiliensis]
MPNEQQPLLTPAAPSREPRQIEGRDILELLKALPDGMAKTYSTFGPIAILYSPGLWLIAPVMTGGVISVSEKTFELLAERYPDHELIKTIAKLSKNTNQIVINFFEDFGFTYSLMTTVAAQVGGIKYYSNAFAKFTAPLVSFLPSVVVRYARYRQANNEENSTALNAFAGAIDGANSPIFTTQLLQMQGVIPVVSPIPIAIATTTGAVGFFSGLAKKSWPRTSLSAETLIAVLENASLAVAFFTFPNDIFAAANNDEISEGFFYTNAAVSCLYLFALFWFTGLSAHQKFQALSAIEELSDDDDLEAGRGSPPLEQEFYSVNDLSGSSSDSSDESEASNDESEDPERSSEETVLILGLNISSSDSQDSDNEDAPTLLLEAASSSSSNQASFFKPLPRTASMESFFDPEKQGQSKHRRSFSG